MNYQGYGFGLESGTLPQSGPRSILVTAKFNLARHENGTGVYHSDFIASTADGLFFRHLKIAVSL